MASELTLAEATPEQIREELEKRERNRQIKIYNDAIYDQMNAYKQKISELSNMIKPLEG